MNTNSISSFRVEVLGDNVQKYASASISGGGGYVTTVNGATYGSTQAVSTEINHHVDQDIWVKDLATDKEMQLNIVETTLPVRPGHILRIAFDKKTDRWERLVNETTDQSGYGNGVVNPGRIEEFLNEGKKGILLAIGLAIPMVNWIVGLIVLKALFVSAPSSMYGASVPDSGKRLLIAFMSGVGVFCFGSMSALLYVSNHKVYAFLALCGLAFAFIYFVKSYQSIYQAAADVIKQRASLLDSSVARSAFS